MLYYMILYYTMLYYMMLYYNILYYTIRYYIKECYVYMHGGGDYGRWCRISGWGKHEIKPPFKYMYAFFQADQITCIALLVL